MYSDHSARTHHTCWMPANDAARLLVHASAIGEDLGRLLKLMAEQRDPYDRKLLFKFVVVEFISFMENFDRLKAVAVRAPVADGSRPVDLGTTIEENERLRELLRSYHKEREQVMARLAAIRNRIAAHRSEIEWHDMADLWRSLSIDLIRPVYAAAREAFHFIRDLGIYEWFRKTPNESFQFNRPLPLFLFVDEPEILIHPTSGDDSDPANGTGGA
jgi:hypothetical protein